LPDPLRIHRRLAVAEGPTPEQIENIEFHVTVRGYARDEVRECLSALAAYVANLEEKAATGYLNLGEKIGELLQQAKDTAEEIEAVARDEAARTLADAGTHAAKIVGEAEQRVVELTNVEGEIINSLQSLKTQLEGMTARLRPVEFKAETGVE
jgi:DivIVA domain-containing protein